MIQIQFKNLNKSQTTKETTLERVQPLIEKFSDLSKSKIQITLEMENSPKQAGPDLYKVKFHIICGRFNGITVEKSDSNLYVALAEVVDHMLEVLNRFGDRNRVKERKQARKILSQLAS